MQCTIMDTIQAQDKNSDVGGLTVDRKPSNNNWKKSLRESIVHYQKSG